MSNAFPMPSDAVLEALHEGLVIPAHPLALTDDRRLDECRQRGLSRYYHAAGAGGVAVAVHTTQFEIRQPQYGLLQPVLELAAETIRACDSATRRRSVLIAGVCGDTQQAVQEAALANDLGYDIGLLSLAALGNASDDALIEHCTTVAKEIPLFGFYLQPAVGGRVLSRAFWERFVEIPNVVGIKMAPFNRYQTLDVVHAVASAGREEEIALYTGNDDNIVVDLLTEFVIPMPERTARLRIVGGLLGHWACWTHAAVALHQDCQDAVDMGSAPEELLTRAMQVTDCNAALFDAANGFAGCIAGIHEVLRAQGLLANRHCLNPNENLSPGQLEELDRVRRAYPDLIDDTFIAMHLDDWLTG